MPKTKKSVVIIMLPHCTVEKIKYQIKSNRPPIVCLQNFGIIINTKNIVLCRFVLPQFAINTTHDSHLEKAHNHNTLMTTDSTLIELYLVQYIS